MTEKKFRRAVQPSTERPIFDRLRDNPIWVFGSGVAAASAFVVAVVTPLKTTFLISQIEKLKTAGEQLESVKAELKKTTDELKKAQTDLQDATLV